MGTTQGRNIEQFHSGEELQNPDDTITRLVDADSIAARYRLPGPHTTVVTRLAVPGDARDDVNARWHATLTDLRRMGSSDETLHRLDHVVDALTHSGHSVLITATAQSAAYCWLTQPSVNEFMRVDDVPNLVPAIDEVTDMGIVVGGIVDRSGVDIYVVDHVEVRHESSRTDIVEEDAVDRSRRKQRRMRPHADQELRAVAHRTAEQLANVVAQTRATLVVLTGDNRTVSSVIDDLSSRVPCPVRHIDAGDRKGPTSRERLHRAAHEASDAERQRAFESSIERLREELGQHDRAVAGVVPVLEEVSQSLVGTLFVDPSQWTDIAHVDEIIRAGFASGARVVPFRNLGVTDGVAGLLRTTLDHTT